MKTATLYRIAYGLGIASAVAIVVAHLALTDIRHGEADVSLEWGALRVAILIIIAFHVAALASLRRAMRDVS